MAVKKGEQTAQARGQSYRAALRLIREALRTRRDKRIFFSFRESFDAKHCEVQLGLLGSFGCEIFAQVGHATRSAKTSKTFYATLQKYNIGAFLPREATSAIVGRLVRVTSSAAKLSCPR